VFSVRYELNVYISIRRNLVLKGLMRGAIPQFLHISP
jgi:hypothetical protein